MEFRTLTKRIAQKFDVEIPTSDTLDPDKNIIHSEQIPFDTKQYEHIKTSEQLQTWI